MSDVKQRVIDIVMGREPSLPKNLVRVAPDEMVVKSDRLLAIEYMALKAEEQRLQDKVTLPTEYGDYTGLTIEPDDPETFYLGTKGTITPNRALGPIPITDPELLSALKESAPDPTGDNTELSAKPFVRFKMLWDHYGFIRPREGFWPHPLPRIVL